METSAFQAAKIAIVEALGLSKDALHVHFGLAIMLLAALALRRPVGSLLPWLAVLAAAVGGELWDAVDDIRMLGEWRTRASIRDLFNTLLWPTVLLGLAKARLISRVRRSEPPRRDSD